jgi:threonine dehydrogenase-like Zn-dependent dehydrogenase
MSEETKVKCEKEWDELVKLTADWVDLQRKMLEEEPTPEKIEEITKKYEEMIKKGKEFAKCELSPSS